MDFNFDVNRIIQTAYKAGEKILEIYNSDSFDIEIKGDKSPLTRADKAANEIIVKYLEKTEIPVLSEEGKTIPFEVRKNWNFFWMVDPLDGTKEFIKRNGEFTVNIALIEKQKPIFGIVYAPILDKMYVGEYGKGAYMIVNNKTITLKREKLTNNTVRIVASRSHLNEETANFINSYKNTEIVSMGSSLKFMVIAEGNADIYPRFAPTMEWDTAAAHAILRALMINVINYNTKKELVYNKPNLLNPHFLVNNLDKRK